MQSATEHSKENPSPLPWSLDLEGENGWLICAADGKPVISRIRPKDNQRPDRERLLNAIFVHRAANSHYQLLEACKAAYEAMMNTQLLPTQFQAPRDQLRAAIRAAEGEASEQSTA